MKFINDTTELDLVLWGVGKSPGLRQEDLAALAVVGPVFAGDVECWKASLATEKFAQAAERGGCNWVLEYVGCTDESFQTLLVKHPSRFQSCASKLASLSVRRH